MVLQRALCVPVAMAALMLLAGTRAQSQAAIDKGKTGGKSMSSVGEFCALSVGLHERHECFGRLTCELVASPLELTVPLPLTPLCRRLP